MNKKVIVIYSSRYGNTKQYAELIAKRLNAEAVDVDKVNTKDLDSSDIIIYGSGLYAGKMKKAKLLEMFLDKELVAFTVGLASPETTDFKPVLNMNFSEEIQKQIKFFHLRGGINYKNLSTIHRFMMWVMVTFILGRIPESEKSHEQKMMKKTYGENVEFFEAEQVDPIIEYIEKLKLS